MSSPTPRRAWTVVILVALGAAAISVALTCWAMRHLVMRIPLRDQSMRAMMPPDLPVSVQVLHAQAMEPGAVEGAGSNEGAGADGRNDEGVPVRLNERLQLQADFDAQVPLKMTVRYRGEIPVKAQVPMKTEIRTRVLGVPMTLPIEGVIPLDVKLPVDLKIPVDQSVRLKFSAPVSARIDQVVHIPFRAQLDARIRFVDETLPIVVREADLQVPLREISVSSPAAP